MSHSDDYFRDPPPRRIGALALIRAQGGADDRTLLVDKAYRQNRAPHSWGLVGGSVEAWTREVAEETGLRLQPGRLLAVDYVPATKTSAEGYNYVYDGGVIRPDTAIVLPEQELLGYAFVSPRDLERHLTPHAVRRVLAALDALAKGTTADLVRGYPADEWSSQDLPGTEHG
ncbi:NUDIX hydrolase [Streptomyces scopuliridis]|uniref:NUDIX hydrolase n=1 Tax=Streptomyces scopuliridis TaxID=452529 RepID=A0ACD4ZT72_9ACTN|nr:NUDIX hydrolase [Streptomyces scopuliridis]WSC01703.1 NUDIX hydrolase [Streptomyces scopuliridis]WSC04758.1 NUDIX hydrolase [Streptomyces scopuliridis]